MNLIKILETIRPGAEWTLDGDEYDGLTWLDSEQPKPTAEEVEAARPAAVTASHKQAVDERRRLAYRQSADPLFFKWQRGEATEQEWLDAVQAVKDEYPDEPPL